MKRRSRFHATVCAVFLAGGSLLARPADAQQMTSPKFRVKTQAADSGGTPTGLCDDRLRSKSFQTTVIVGRSGNGLKISATPSTFKLREGYIPTVDIAPVVGVQVVSVIVPHGTQGIAYSQTLVATGGKSPYTWAVVAGALPAGLSLSSSGVISGTPTTVASNVAIHKFTVEVTDSTTPTAKKAKRELAIKIACPPTITTASLPNGVENELYRQSLASTGGNAPFTWSVVSGSLPLGMTLDAAGNLTGTPTQSGSFNFTARVTDSTPLSGPATADKALTLVVGSAFQIATASLPAGVKTLAYDQTLASSGGNAPITWSIVSGALPPGLMLTASTGRINGTPTQDGAFVFTVQAADSSTILGEPFKRTQAYTLAIAVPPSVLTESAPNGVLGAAYSHALASRGGNAPVTWSIVSGTLPAGLALDAATGVISGTPTAAGTNSFTAKATDSTAAPGPASATKALSITVTGTTTLAIAAPLAVPGTPPALPKGVVDDAYDARFTATGGTTPYTWTGASGTLQAGLSFSSSNNEGVIQGVPSEKGPKTFTVRVTDSSGTPLSTTKEFTLDIAPALKLTTGAPALAVTTQVLPNAVPGQAYSHPLQVNEGNNPLSWQVTVGTLPNGIALSPIGVLTGTPSSAGVSSFTVQVTDSTLPTAQTATKALTLTVSSALTIAPIPFPNGVAGQSYSSCLHAAGGATPYTWSIVAGALPAGLALDPVTGNVFGTPAAAGTSNFTARVTDSTLPTALTDDEAFTLTIDLAAPPPPSLVKGVQGLAYSQTLASTGGNIPVAWSSGTAPAIPNGLALDTRTGILSGTPTQNGTFDVAFTVSDDTLSQVGGPAQHSRVLRVAIAAPLLISPPTLPDASVSTPYSVTLSPGGGNGPFAWALVSGTLPAGLALNTSTGVISGTPVTAGQSTFRIRVTDSTPSPGPVSREQDFSINVAGPFSIATQSLPNPAVGVSYSQTLTTSGGNPPATWDVSAGSLPPGLALSVNGVVAGTPTASGTFTFTARARDTAVGGGQATATQSLTLTVAPALAITTTSLPQAILSVAYNEPVTTSGGNAPLTWTISAGTLPPGLVLSAANGNISGTPTSLGTFGFTVKVTDSTPAPGAMPTQALSITVGVSVAPSPPSGVAATPGNNQIALTWSANPPGELVTTYRVFRSGTALGPYFLKGEVSAPTTTFNDTTAVNGTRFFYVLKAVNNAGTASAYSAEMDATANGTDVTPPARPVILTQGWRSKDTTPAISGTAEPSATVEIVNSALAVLGTGATNSFGNWTVTTSTLSPDGAYTLFARARDAAGNTSGFSSSIVITIDTAPPLAVGGLVLNPGGGYVDLSWSPSGETDLLGYEVWRATASGGPYTRVSTVSGNGDPPNFPNGGVVIEVRFRDKTVTNGTTYFYKVLAVDSASDQPP